ncbi:hypothetical protein [Asticcacaulis biprosthecium]|uniref:hypothetical protein n=1 Tax=Asticcacaulis biprosthecium TaxID=76891 RepID=UPI0005901EDF|nr:hypothetical protein [Asticcacaulis biprosthecium]
MTMVKFLLAALFGGLVLYGGLKSNGVNEGTLLKICGLYILLLIVFLVAVELLARLRKRKLK